MVIADETADCAVLLADLLSQAEHGPDAQVILCTNSINLRRRLNQEWQEQLSCYQESNRQLRLKNGRIIIVNHCPKNEITDRYAPEHLSLQCENPDFGLKAFATQVLCFVGPMPQKHSAIM